MNYIKRGTAPSLPLQLPFPVSDLATYEIAIVQDHEIVATKSPDECEVLGENVLVVKLTEADTIRLSPRRIAIQLRGKDADGMVLVSDHVVYPVEDSNVWEALPT